MSEENNSRVKKIQVGGTVAEDQLYPVGAEPEDINIYINSEGKYAPSTDPSIVSTKTEPLHKVFGEFKQSINNIPYPAEIFNSTKNYKVGDYVSYNGLTYKFVIDHNASTWNDNHATPVHIAGQYVTAGKKEETTLGECATTEGFNTTASGKTAHAEGYNTQALNNYSHAEGYQTKTETDYQHVQGKFNIGKSNTLFEIGNGESDTNRSNAFEVDNNGNAIASRAFMNKTQELAPTAPTFNNSTNYKVGDYVVYNGETYRCTVNHTASSWNSSNFTKVYPAGQYVTAGKATGSTLGINATAEGSNTIAQGNSSHAEGRDTQALYLGSHAEGIGTKTNANYQHVEGKYNIGKSTTLFEIGNGTADTRKNAFEVDTSGNVVAGGTITDKNGGHCVKIDTNITANSNNAARSGAVVDALSMKSNLIKVERKAVTHPSGMRYSSGIVTKSGYTPLGIVGIFGVENETPIVDFRIDYYEGQYRAYISFNSNTNYVTAVDVLYVKNS